MPGKVKRCGYISYGYCGWHLTWEKKKVFLRSTKEFIYAKVLDFEKESYSTEAMFYLIGTKTYKPDFFLFTKEGFLRKIVEVKSNKPDALKAKEAYAPFFRDTLQVDYEVIWAFDKLITKYNLKPFIEEWIASSIKEYAKISYSGNNNPRYGQVCTQETKTKISSKAIERSKDPEYRKKQSLAQIERAKDSVTRNALYRTRTINFLRKVIAHFKITKEVFMENIDEYSSRARIEGVLPSNSGISNKTILKYSISLEDI